MTRGRAVGLTMLVSLACSKPGAPVPGSVSSAPDASAAPASRRGLLSAELRRDPGAVPEEELLAESPARRLAAVRALARIQDERSFDTLGKALADEHLPVLGWAAFGVGQLCRGHEPEGVQRLALRAATLASQPVTAERDQALGAIALALGRCGSDEAERSLRGWLKLRPTLAGSAALGLALVARQRKRLDDASIAALLDLASKQPASPALHAIESVPNLGAAARERLLEVASRTLEAAGDGRAYAVRALAKAGSEAAPVLGRVLGSDTTSDAERADAARSLGALGSAAQSELSGALKLRARRLIDDKAWLTSQHGVVLTLLEALEPKSAEPDVLSELSTLPLEGEPPPIARRKVMLRCRAAALLAGRASLSAALLACDPAPPAERREGSLALLKVLGRGPLGKERGARFQELARSDDRVVREAALELLMAHDEVENAPELLAAALGASAPGVRATAAKVLARYPARARPAERAPADPRVVQALTQQLNEVGRATNIELSSLLLDAATALELLGAKPALERACASTNPTLRKHAEKGYAELGEPLHRCPGVAGSETWQAGSLPDYRLELETDVGPLSLLLHGGDSPFATERFVALSRSGYFDGMAVHRVVPGFVVQLGDPEGDGFGGPNLPPLRCQVGPEAFQPGSVGVALAGRDTGGSQLFVALRAAPHLAGEYSQIGVAEPLPDWERLAPGDRILKVRVLEASGK
jgi:cyclophilin family peptidyl-prolyl cis-trans isomerase